MPRKKFITEMLNKIGARAGDRIQVEREKNKKTRNSNASASIQ